MAKSYLEGQDEFSDDWKNIFKKIPLEIAKKFALGIAHIHRSEPKHEHKGTYSSLSESPKLGCLNPGNLLKNTELFVLKLRLWVAFKAHRPLTGQVELLRTTFVS